MKRSLSTVLNALLFTITIVPNAMAQVQQPGFSLSSSIVAGAIAEEPTADTTNQTATNQTVTKTDAAPDSSGTVTPTARATNIDKARPGNDSAFPGYCPSLRPGVQPGDWEYREALERCLHGN